MNLSTAVEIKSFGPCGDTAWEDTERGAAKPTGSAYYDNMKLFAGSDVLASYDFDTDHADVQAHSCSANDDSSHFANNSTHRQTPRYLLRSGVYAPSGVVVDPNCTNLTPNGGFELALRAACP